MQIINADVAKGYKLEHLHANVVLKHSHKAIVDPKDDCKLILVWRTLPCTIGTCFDLHTPFSGSKRTILLLDRGRMAFSIR